MTTYFVHVVPPYICITIYLVLSILLYPLAKLAVSASFLIETSFIFQRLFAVLRDGLRPTNNWRKNAETSVGKDEEVSIEICEIGRSQ